MTKMRIRIPPAPPESGVRKVAFLITVELGGIFRNSIAAAPRWGDRLFRLTSLRFAFYIKSAPAGSDLKLHAPPKHTLSREVYCFGKKQM